MSHQCNNYNFSVNSAYFNLDFENDVFPIKSQISLESVEFVKMMRDVLRMNKNLCVSRNFSKLKKDQKR